MKWIVSNERRPGEDGDYYAEDTVGNKTLCSFFGKHWHSRTGHPIAKWLDEAAPSENAALRSRIKFLENLISEYTGKMLGVNGTNAQ